VASTICKCHNETVNVWTHFLGGIGMFIFAMFIIVVYKNYEAVGTEGWDSFTSRHDSYNSA